jgi:hypothetical protein
MSMAKCQDRWHRGSKADGQRRRPQAIGISRGTPAAGVGTHRCHVVLEAHTNVRLMVQSYTDGKAVGIAFFTLSRQCLTTERYVDALGITLLLFSKLILLVPMYDLVIFAFDFFVA